VQEAKTRGNINFIHTYPNATYSPVRGNGASTFGNSGQLKKTDVQYRYYNKKDKTEKTFHVAQNVNKGSMKILYMFFKIYHHEDLYILRTFFFINNST
jgi:hypothetical protein